MSDQPPLAAGQPAPLSARDAAFLAEMGITPLWQARATSATSAITTDSTDSGAAVASAAPPLALAPAAPVAPAPEADAPQLEADIGQMDWRSLNNAIAACARCGCKDGRKSVAGDGARAAVWMVVAGATTTQDESERQPLAGAPGKLLANMLKAVQLSREENVYVTNLVKCRLSSASGGERAPTADEIQACRPFVERELALCGAGVVLTLGQVATNALLDQPAQQALAGSRGVVHQFNGAALVATLHPAELLRRGGDKAQAWADLCLARASHGQPQ
jgi:uracil-DNA glycosylase family 4